jgi:hypothetical protein
MHPTEYGESSVHFPLTSAYSFHFYAEENATLIEFDWSRLDTASERRGGPPVRCQACGHWNLPHKPVLVGPRNSSSISISSLFLPLFFSWSSTTTHTIARVYYGVTTPLRTRFQSNAIDSRSVVASRKVVHRASKLKASLTRPLLTFLFFFLLDLYIVTWSSD